LKQTTLVARLEAGSDALEKYRVGAWRKTTALRDAKLVMYPRAAGGGGLAMPATIAKRARWRGVVAEVPDRGVGRPLGYCYAGDECFYRDLMSGTFVYMPEKGPCRGRLFMVSDHTKVGILSSPCQEGNKQNPRIRPFSRPNLCDKLKKRSLSRARPSACPREYGGD